MPWFVSDRYDLISPLPVDDKYSFSSSSPAKIMPLNKLVGLSGLLCVSSKSFAEKTFWFLLVLISFLTSATGYNAFEKLDLFLF
ncbi:hypothetical protein [Hydrogenophaga sp.]|uniref:hypothetical protein n=1 Tax=Hydrogenophaga sp. TaxID=1904254 RepID=UPI003AF71C14